jgi:hypothetical protein
LRRTSFVTLLILCSGTVLAAPHANIDRGQQASSAEQEIRRIETLRLQYPLESAKWADYVDDNAVFTEGSGKVHTKAEIVRLLHQPEWSFDNSLEMLEAKFKQFGDTAVLSYIYTRSRRDGEYTIREHVRKTAVYLQQNSKWQIVASKSQSIPRFWMPTSACMLEMFASLAMVLTSWRSHLTTKKRSNF